MYHSENTSIILRTETKKWLGVRRVKIGPGKARQADREHLREGRFVDGTLPIEPLLRQKS
jgi:hypothetical protein